MVNEARHHHHEQADGVVIFHGGDTAPFYLFENITGTPDPCVEDDCPYADAGY